MSKEKLEEKDSEKAENTAEKENGKEEKKDKKAKKEKKEKIPRPKRKMKKWVKRIIIIAVILAVALVALHFCTRNKNPDIPEETTTTAVVTRGDIENKVTGSGTVEANETYNIVPTVNGEITFCDVEEGDHVEEGQILYQFDSETSDNAIKTAENRVKTAQNSLESARMRLEQVRENIGKLTIKAPERGVVSDLNVVVGDDAGGILCTITDNTYMTAKIPVPASSASNVKVGDSVTVGLEKYMTHLPGSVERISNAQVAGSNGSMVTYIDIRLDNPGSISEGTMATATIHSASGDVEGASAAELAYPKGAKANAEQSGTISQLKIQNGDWVDKGDVIAVLTSQSLTDSLRDAEMSYDNALTSYQDAETSLSDTRKQAEDSTLKAPIAGEVLSKEYKKGDTVYGQNSTTLMVVADTSKMKFTLNVDELDVAKISVGQDVVVTADAIEGQTFMGKITTVSLLGNSANGVTYYPIVITVDEPGELLPGMNVNAEIIAQSVQNVLVVPVGAVSYYDGKYYATVVGEQNTSSPGEAPSGEEPSGERPTFSGSSSGSNSAAGGGRGGPGGPGGGPGAMPMGGMNGGGMAGGTQGGDGGAEGGENENITMYPEPQRVEVTTGVSNDEYIEIVSGLTEGQVVSVSASTDSGWGGMGMMAFG